MDLSAASWTVYGEARREPNVGKAGVAWVIRNRVARPRWWGHDVFGVCHAPRQFSCWDPDDPNCFRLGSEAARADPAFLVCEQIVSDVFAGVVPDPTGGADHYLTTVSVNKVGWARTTTPTAVIGRHSFFRLES